MRLSKTLKLGSLLFLPESIAKALSVTAFCLLKSMDVTACLTGVMENMHCPFWIPLGVEIYNYSHFWQRQQQKKKLSLGCRKFAVTFIWNLKQNNTSLAENKYNTLHLHSFHTASQAVFPTVRERYIYKLNRVIIIIHPECQCWFSVSTTYPNNMYNLAIFKVLSSN